MKIAPLAAAVALAALLVAGCGGDNKNAVTTTAASAGAATTAGGSSATTRPSSATTGGSTGGSTTAPSFSGSGDNEFCQRARDLEGSDIADALSGEGDLKATLQTAKSALADLKSSAPAEIKDDVNTLANAFDKLDTFYAKYDYDQAKLLAAAQKDPSVLQEATSALSDPKFEAAASRVAAYGTQVCGIEDSTTTSA
jgi:hypothetical protein